jgi:hypothetical protein
MFKIRLRALCVGAMAAGLLMAGPSRAWDATTRLTNVPISDEDVGAVLSSTITASFDEAFPPPRYSIHVLVDGIDLRTGQDVIYLSVGLARRLPSGEHLQQHANLSAVVMRASAEARPVRREIVMKALSELSASFAKLLEQNAARVR